MRAKRKPPFTETRPMVYAACDDGGEQGRRICYTPEACQRAKDDLPGSGLMALVRRIFRRN